MATPDRQLRPRDLVQHAVDHVKDRPAGAVVGEHVGVERHNGVAAQRELVRAAGGGACGVDPTVERGHQDRGHEPFEGSGHPMEGHPFRIGVLAVRRVPRSPEPS
jgi:hypothetical protein